MLPRRMQKYAAGLRSAPVSHVAAFLVLHEVTAVVPLLGLWGLFHYAEWAPLDYVTRHWAGYVRDGTGRAERYFRRRGWFGFGGEEDSDAGAGAGREDAAAGNRMGGERRRRAEPGAGMAGADAEREEEPAAEEPEHALRLWLADARYRVVVEVALAWAITKVLLPARLVVSVWATPWFAGVMGRAAGIFRRKR